MPRKKLPAGYYEWTPELAYAVGLIVIDGNLSGDGRHIILRSKDIEQIKNSKKCLRLKNKIGSTKKTLSNGSTATCYRVQFGNVQFYRWLELLGLTPAKTYSIPRLPVPDLYFRDFLRGHLDGDGTITTYTDVYNIKKNAAYRYVRLFLCFLSASEPHLRWVQETVQRLIGIKGDFWKRVSKDVKRVDMWQLKYMKKDSRILIPWLYYAKDLPCLQRKREKAERALIKIESVRRKKYTRVSQ
ncbi:MAG: hypothetical protein Q8P56_06055 [Candidatus Uhrbacteria bacterium]|nr:hypothetical protein [Candidatus Uhrbacteria bacterium]